MKRLNTSGSHVVALVVGVLVVGVIGMAGYKVWQNSKTPVTDTATTVKTSSAVPSTIKSNADLTNASKALDDSSAQVNSNLDDNSLNSDLNDLL